MDREQKQQAVADIATRLRETETVLALDQCRQIAECKMPGLNANDLDAASRIVAGTARSMGVEVEGMEV